MPELPEVETVRRTLLPYLPGRRITKVEIRDPKVIVMPTPDRYPPLLEGQRFEALERIGKQLIFRLERHALLVHLGMTGQLTYRTPERDDEPFTRAPVTGLQRTLQHPVDKHTHITLELDDGTAVHYRDIRKFGKWRLVELWELPDELRGLGPDPLTEKYTWDEFYSALKATRRAVKAVLLDQGVLAGVGNIYADEALFLAGLRPERTAQKLSKSAARKLFEAVPEVLKKGLANRGTSFSDYRDAEGNKGSNQDELWAYGRYGLPCLKCGTALRRSDVAQRTSSWCPKCQR